MKVVESPHGASHADPVLLAQIEPDVNKGHQLHVRGFQDGSNECLDIRQEKHIRRLSVRTSTASSLYKEPC